MKTYLAEALDPLIFRDGRPFAAEPGAMARSQALPPPSAIAGAVRTRAGSDAEGRFDKSRIEELLAGRILGPSLAVRTGASWQWVFPAPADALVHFDEDRGDRTLEPLLPFHVPAGQVSTLDWPCLVGPAMLARPHTDPDAHPLWRWSELKRWLATPDRVTIGDSGLGLPYPSHEPRMHVAIDPTLGTALDSALFGTVGRAWWSRATDKTPERRLAIAVRSDLVVRPGPAAIGGEQRAAQWSEVDLPFPKPPAEVVRSVREGFARLVFTTPASFTTGSRPEPAALGLPEGSHIAAAVHGRPITISGWDYAYEGKRGDGSIQRGRPKATRRLLPTGTVFFLELGGDADERERWLHTTWGTCLSDDAQSARDGFGLALVGAWPEPHRNRTLSSLTELPR